MSTTKTVALSPRLNEKTYGLADDRVYVFDVERSVNRHDIARAVEAQFEVKVASVNTMKVRGKTKRTMSLSGKRYSSHSGQRSDVKKAYVTLAEGHSLPFFQAIEEEIAKEEATQEKIDKAAAKQAAKDAKASAKSAKSEAKPAAKAAPKAKTSKVEPAKAAEPVKKAAKKPVEIKEPAPTHEAKKPRLSAWRGFRLRKRKPEDK